MQTCHRTHKHSNITIPHHEFPVFKTTAHTHTHTHMTNKGMYKKQNNSEPFPSTCTYFKDQKIMSHEVLGTSAISQQGNWTQQHNHNFQEESPILSMKSVAGLASAHGGNGQIARIFFV